MLGLKAKLEHPWLCPGGFSKREVESRPRFDVPPATAVLLVVRSAGHPLCVTSLLSGLGQCDYVPIRVVERLSSLFAILSENFAHVLLCCRFAAADLVRN